MAIIPVTDLNDPRIALYRNLKTTNLTRRGSQFVVEGEKLFERLLQSPFPITSALVTDRQQSRIARRLPDETPLYVVPHSLIHLLVGFNFHQGVLASGLRRPWPELAEIVKHAGPRSTVVVCPELYNPENLGTLIRIADVFGIDAILVGRECPDPLSRRVLRVSMGMALHRPVIVSDNLVRDVQRLREDWGVQFAATVTDPDAEPLDQADRPDRFALLLGSEGHGLSPEWVSRCDRRITIPMRPGAESLNVAVAAGILLYHFTQRFRERFGTH